MQADLLHQWQTHISALCCNSNGSFLVQSKLQMKCHGLVQLPRMLCAVCIVRCSWWVQEAWCASPDEHRGCHVTVDPENVTLHQHPMLVAANEQGEQG